MHTHLKVVKEAEKQLRKAEGWIRSALEDDDGESFDPDLLERFNELTAELHTAFKDYQP